MYCTNCGKESPQISNYCYHCGMRLNQSSEDDKHISINGILNNHEWVDLGLQVRWASCNIGANVPSDYGNYYQWGNPAPKRKGTIDNKPHNSLAFIAGIPEYDMALSNWGCGWRLPTKDDIEELVTMCNWQITELNGVSGYKVVGPNGNSIFLPFGGAIDGDDEYYEKYNLIQKPQGCFWSSTKNFDLMSDDCAYCLTIETGHDFRIGTCPDCSGLSVRPVCNYNDIHCQHCGKKNSNDAKYCYYCGNKIIHVTKFDIQADICQGYLNGRVWVDLGLSVKWASCNVGANSPGDYGDYYSWGETVKKTNYSRQNYSLHNQKIDNISGSIRYDAATANWGKGWRIPTFENFAEMLRYCNWQWCVMDSHYGYKITGQNGSSIFLPAAGCRLDDIHREIDRFGSYWSTQESWLGVPSEFVFNADEQEFVIDHSHNEYFGQPIRPICD